MQMTVYETRKNNLLKMLEFYESRKAFCEKLGVEYNHLNQYLGKKSKKNIGDKFSEKVTEAHNLPLGWMDQPQDILTIKNIVESNQATNIVVSDIKSKNKSTNHPSIDQNDVRRIVPLKNILKMSKGEDLAVNENIEEIKNIDLPAGINNPIAYLIRGTGFSKPYRNGYVVVCEFSGSPIPGEEILIFCKDGSIYAGEFQREEDILISIDSVDGSNDRILKEKIARISPIKMFISPSQIK